MKCVDDAQLEYALACARPTTVTLDRQFTDTVMSQITHSQVKKGRGFSMSGLFGRLRALPIGAVILGVILSAVLLGGAVYAAYQLWPRPTATVTQTKKNDTGRKELTVLMQDCEHPGSRA